MSADLETKWAQGLAGGELAFPRCSACRAWNWYPLPQCSQCRNHDTPWTVVSPTGRIFSWTRSHFDFTRGCSLSDPAIIALVEMADAPQIRIPCRPGISGLLPVIGEAVRLEPAHHDGHAFWSFVPQRGAVDAGDARISTT